MIRTVGYCVAAIFAVLGLFYVYWAAGGRFGSAVSVPTRADVRIFDPSPAATVFVAAACFAAMLVVLGRLGLVGGQIPPWIFRGGCFVIAAVFCLRAIGDFRFIGFFKEVTETGFAVWDTFLFSPLCLFIASAAFAVGLSGPKT